MIKGVYCMKDIKKDKNLKKTAKLELDKTQMNNVSGGLLGPDFEMKTGNINIDVKGIQKDIKKGSINIKTSGTGNTAQNNGSINF